MKLQDLEFPQFGKAGFIPYIFDEHGEPVFMFMIPSDPKFGGTRPAIAKGYIDEGESAFVAALREAEEELGLRKSNVLTETIKLAYKNKTKGEKFSYTFTVYAAEVKDQHDFSHPHFETGSVHWLTAQQFAEHGRKTQKRIVEITRQVVMSNK